MAKEITDVRQYSRNPNCYKGKKGILSYTQIHPDPHGLKRFSIDKRFGGKVNIVVPGHTIMEFREKS